MLSFLSGWLYTASMKALSPLSYDEDNSTLLTITVRTTLIMTTRQTILPMSMTIGAPRLHLSAEESCKQLL